MSEKVFSPKHGDIIVCNNGKRHICASAEEVYSKVRGDPRTFYSDHSIYAYAEDLSGFMVWQNNGIASPADWSIKEIISMSIKQPHKHAELIKAWADGAVIQYFNVDYNDWRDTIRNNPSWKTDTQYRIKPEEPKYIEVNGVKVPEPYRVKPEDGTTYYVPSINGTRELVGNWRWTNHNLDCINFQNGQCFKTAEDAALACEAMLKPFKV